MEEIWKDVKDYEGLYQISNLGRIKSLPKKTNNQYSNIEIIMKQPLQGIGYYSIQLRKDKKFKTLMVHRLLSEVFIPNPENKKQVNHINGIKSDNRLENLEWVTSSENMKHAFRTGLKSNHGEFHPMHKLSEIDVKIIRRLYNKTLYFKNIIILAEIFNVTKRNIRFIVNNKSWINVY